MSDNDQGDERLMSSLRAYGAVLDRAAEAEAAGDSDAAPVTDLVLPGSPNRPSRRFLLAAAAIVVVLAAGVSVVVARDVDSGPHFRPGSSTSTVPTVPPTTTHTAPPTVRTSTADVLVATTEGVLRFDADGTSHRVVDGSVEVAVSDTAGGVVFQHSRGEATRSIGDATLWHLPAGATEPVVVVHATGGEWLELWDVATMDGDVVVVYSRHDAPSPQDSLATDKPADTLQVTSLATGDTRTIAKVGGWEWGPVAISAAGDRFALETGAEVEYSFEFLNTHGSVVRVLGNPFDDSARFPSGGCPDDPTCPTGLAIADDGSRFAYIEPVDGKSNDHGFVAHDYRIVVVDATTGKSVGTVAVHFPERDQSYISVRTLDLADDDTVIVNWSSIQGTTTTIQNPLVAHLDSGQVSTLPVAGDARAG